MAEHLGVTLEHYRIGEKLTPENHTIWDTDLDIPAAYKALMETLKDDKEFQAISAETVREAAERNVEAFRRLEEPPYSDPVQRMIAYFEYVHLNYQK